MTRNELGPIGREQRRKIELSRQTRFLIVEADYGRELLWEVWWKGVIVAVLTDPQPEPEGWTSYQIIPLETEANTLLTLNSVGFWLHPEVEFRHTDLGIVATRAFAAGDGPIKGRIMLHGLEFDVELSVLDRLYLLCRSVRAIGRHQKAPHQSN